MCDIHICDKLASKIAEAGPELAVEILPENYLLHISTCEVCFEKILQMTMLTMDLPTGHIM